MRKYYMDNLRWIVILLLFPYHTLLIYSGIGSYYFHVANNIFADTFILIFAPWFMQLLFVIAGIATFYSLKKRNITQYLKERVSKLLIPLIAGMILVIPFSVYFVFLFYGYTGNFIDLWISIFTNPDHIVGIFTTSNHTAIGWSLPIGPLWFLLYLFIVSLLALPLILKHDKQNYIIKKFTIPKLLLMVFPLTIGNYFLNIFPEKSIIGFFLLFVFGYFLLSDDTVQQKLEKYRWPLFISFIILLTIYIQLVLGGIGSSTNTTTATSLSLSTIIYGFLANSYINLIMWLGMLGIIGMGKHYLEFKNKATIYLSSVSFPIYIFHIVWINMFTYYIIKWIPNQIAIQVILIMVLSFIMTIINIEVIRRIPLIKTLFGMKN